MNKTTKLSKRFDSNAIENIAFITILFSLALWGLQVFGIGSDYWSSVLVMGGIYALLAMGLNIVVGFAGLLDLGYAGFWAIGAYVTAFVTGKAPFHPLSISVWGAIPFAILFTILSGLILGIACLRVRGDYLAIATLGFGEIIRILANYWGPVTNGPGGVTGIPHPQIFGFNFGLNPRPYIVFIWILIIILYLLITNLWRSRLGRAWYATKLDEEAAETIGVPTFKMKLFAFAMGAMTAGFAGVIYSSYVGYISPDNFLMFIAILIMASVVLGGMGNIHGVILGGFIIILLPEIFRQFETLRYLFFGSVLVLMMIIRPKGLLPLRPRRYSLPDINRKGEMEEIESGARSNLNQQLNQELIPNARIDHVNRDNLLLECKDITRQFGGLTALKNVGFRVPKGIILAIIGPNGAGKTTLFNIITGLLAVDNGQICFEGKYLPGLKPHNIAKLGIARTFQLIRLFPDVTVTENVLVGLDIRSKSNAFETAIHGWRYNKEEKESLQKVTEIMSFCGILHLANELAGNLPYGYQRRVEIARALATQPHLLLLDEPAAGMNPTEKADLKKLVQKIRAQGITIIIIEHDMNVVMGISDEIIVLDHGCIIAQGTPENVQKNQEVINAYLGCEDDETH
jgi:ABC-type branched-subunit amino acid transport system ATPase component/ABC-type branched-subunit amino acid transport system permease subunit